MNVHAQPYVPKQTFPAVSTPEAEPLAQYLARRNLMNSGLYQFDDKPENYCAWHASFTNTTSDMDLSAAQQLDLMTKWLGKESGEYVKCIRSVYLGIPTEALRMAWERLCVMLPQILWRSLCFNVWRFSQSSPTKTMSNSVSSATYRQILSAKEERYLTGLLYLDTSRGFSSVTEKLPFGLQEKWLTAGSRFKEDSNGRFPPPLNISVDLCATKPKRGMIPALCTNGTLQTHPNQKDLP